MSDLGCADLGCADLGLTFSFPSYILIISGKVTFVYFYVEVRAMLGKPVEIRRGPATVCLTKPLDSTGVFCIPGRSGPRMKASQETDCARRAETPCGDLRPFAEKIGGNAGVFARMRLGSFFMRIFPGYGRRGCRSFRIRGWFGGVARMPHALRVEVRSRRRITGCARPSALRRAFRGSCARGHMKTHWR